MHLRVDRVSGPDSPVLDAADSADRPESAGDLIERIRAQAVFWPPITGAFCSLAANTVGTPNPTPGGLASQYSAPGHYVLDNDDEAMVIEFGAGDAGYVGIQLGSRQFISIDYRDRITSLNPAQLRADADGRFRVVISRKDPGVANWLDPGPHPEGIIFMRWQAMASELPSADHPTAAVVPRHRVRDRADAGGRCTEEQRRVQIHARSASLAPRGDHT